MLSVVRLNKPCLCDPGDDPIPLPTLVLGSLLQSASLGINATAGTLVIRHESSHGRSHGVQQQALESRVCNFRMLSKTRPCKQNDGWSWLHGLRKSSDLRHTCSRGSTKTGHKYRSQYSQLSGNPQPRLIQIHVLNSLQP